MSMLMTQKKELKGFTVVEVALVLAIAGLIFLMVFVALPSLQRLQRDTQRREDMIKLIAAVKKYQSNNRGALPGSNSGSGTSWADFYDKYLDSGFADPSSGTKYVLDTKNCGNAVKAGEECDNADVKNMMSANFPNNYRMLVVLQATCDGVKAIGSSNPRKIALLYTLEGSGTVCTNS